MNDPFSSLNGFVGRRSTSSDVVTAGPVARLAATLGMPQPASRRGEPLPPGWHGLYFGPALRPETLRVDGQAGGTPSLPDVPLKRYRVGLDRAEYPGRLRIGDEIERVSEITDVTVSREEEPVVRIIHRNEIFSPAGLCVIEERESIYFDGKLPSAPSPGPLPQPAWQQTVTPNSILLFRFSALRFNSHRVHYDRTFATVEEGLPGLVVQAALVAQLLLELCGREAPTKQIRSFNPRTLTPIHDNGSFTIYGAPDANGSSATMWAVDSDAKLALVGKIDFST